MKSKAYTIFLALLVVVIAIPTLYFLSSFSDALLNLFRIIFEIRIIIALILGTALGFIVRPFIDAITTKPDDYSTLTMRSTTRRKMPKK